MRPSELIQWLATIAYRGILACFPPDFREDAGELILDFRAAASRASNRGLAPLAVTCTREIFDLARNLIPAWIATMRGGPWSDGRRGMMSWDSIGQDIRFAVRRLRPRAGLTAAIVATMAIAIGGTTATFGVVDAVLLKPLPYPESERLVYLYESFQETQIKSVSFLNFLDWRAENRVFEDLAARTSWSFTMTGDGDAQELSGMLLTPNMLDVLGVQPALGRMFTAAETDAEERLVLLSDAFWRTRFGSDLAVLGRSLTLSGEPYVIVGVLPPNIEFPISETDVWVPISVLSEDDRTRRGSHPGIGAIGRMMSGVALGDAREDMNRVTAALEGRYPESNTEAGAVVTPIMDIYVGGSRRTLWLFLGAVGMVLLIARGTQAGARRMTDRFDSELRSGFQTLRRVELERIPSFPDVLGDIAEARLSLTPSPRASWRRAAFPAGLAAAAIAALVLVPTEDERFEAAIAESVEQIGSGWVSPTDFLLTYTGSEFYSRIPSIGSTPVLGAGDAATNPTSTPEENL